MNPVKKPDLKAPRFRHEFLNVVNNSLLEKIKNKTSKANDLTYQDMRKIINAFNGAMWNHVIESRYGVDLPESLGTVYIGTCKPTKKKNINIPESLKLGFAVEHRNWKTDGYVSKIMFSTYKFRSVFKHSEVWSLTACRDFKRKVAATYPDNWTMYTKLDDTQKIAIIDKKIRKVAFVENRSINIPVDYNEFDLD